MDALQPKFFTIDKLVTFWNQTEGRDCSTKFLQEVSRFFASQTKNAPEISAKLTALYRSASDSRKIYRIGRFINEYIKLKKLFSTPSAEPLVRVLSIISSGCLFFSSLFETANILSKLKILPFDPTKLLKKMAFLALLSMSCTAAMEMMAIWKLLRVKEESEEDMCGKEEGAKLAAVRREELQRQLRRKYLTLLRLNGDMVNMSHFAQILNKMFGRQPLSDGKIAFCSLYASVINLYLQFSLIK